MKLKDLPIFHEAGVEGSTIYIVSMHSFHTIWVKTDLKSDRVYPVNFVHREEILNWRVV